MREKELRLALICYGGVSLAVYMHGITKEIWHLAAASRAFHAGDRTESGTRAVYRRMLEEAETAAGTRLRVMPDILAGASAGGINAIFLAHAIETGQSLEPLTQLWLERADVDILLDPDARPLSRFTKFWAAPILWMLFRRRGDSVERTVSPETREEVRRKLSNFVRARWFAPPFGGAGFVRLLLDAFDAMAAAGNGPPLLPERYPLDLFVTATDFAGHEELLMLNSPRAIVETEHRLSIGFSARGLRPRTLADPAELIFAARATASFPGAFPPFTVRELDKVLAERKRFWPGRAAFLRRILPRQFAAGTAETTPLIDGSVLVNAPFAQAIGALRNRPARREVDRRFVYIEPTPHAEGFRITAAGRREKTSASVPLPGFFRTIFGAVSDIPREQPIRDDLEGIAQRSERIHHMRRVIEAIRPSIDATVEATIGRPLFLDNPTPRRLSSWRAKANGRAARAAGFAYAAYGQLKLARIIDDQAALITAMAEDAGLDVAAVRARLWEHVHIAGADIVQATSGRGQDEQAVQFLREHDIAYRIRRLRFLARRLAESGEEGQADGERQRVAMRTILYDALAQYAALEEPDFYTVDVRAQAAHVLNAPGITLSLLAATRRLRALDEQMEERFSVALGDLAVSDRRRLLRAYLGFPFYDIATLPMLQGEGLDEYDPIKVDRISPEDATAIRSGGVEETLKGIEFNSFGAFFSRAYRENDYLWGRLHGADRLTDILLSALPAPLTTPVAELKRALFEAILDEEEGRLASQGELIGQIRREIG
ncbi:MAG TPA: patatin-like protein [Sphingobium sp.]|nr:patatin-like protein [Sphingobium sp.]